jgi:hypothetical protein
MKRFLLLPLLLILTTCNPVYAGYSVYVAPLIPEFVTVNGPYGSELWPNSAEFAVPAGYGPEYCRPGNYSPFATDPARRTRVFIDSAGTATSSDIFAACSSIKDNKRREIRYEGTRRLLALAAPYTAEERESWPQQKEEALEFQGNPLCTCAMIRNMASSRGIPVDIMAGKILENADLFKAIAGQILGLQQRLLDRIDAATEISELSAITWESQ